MKLKLPLVAAFVTLVSLTACGGGGSDNSSNSPPPATTAVDAPAFSMTETTKGTGIEAVAGKTATVTYTGWLYSATAADHKGTQFQTGSFDFVLGAGNVIAGFEKGVLGMQVGGKRTLVIPSSMGYGASARDGIPPNSGLVFDVTLTALK